MHDNEAVVIIPIYKQQPDGSEIMSLKQCLRVLHRYAVIFIAPGGLETQNYEAVCREYNTAFVIKSFDGRFFRDIAGYNQLMLSAEFYKSFMAFRYMLIY